MSLLKGVEALRVGLDYHLQRHNVLVSNLSQAQTPGYKPVDLARTDFGSELSVALTATTPGHLGVAKEATEPRFGVVKDPDATATSTDGNAVDIDREAVKISTNQMRYDMLAQLASSELASLAWAASDGRTG